MDRWESRWESSKRRYAALETVTLVLPWSTPSMRFCTSELKTHLIGAELRRRFRGETVLNVTGVRREESAARAKGTIATRESDGRAISWRPISDWTQSDVFAYIAANGLPVHQAYTELGMSRVSCRFCIMSKQADLLAAAAAEESHDLYRRMVALESVSTFAFQGSRWLGDIAPELLSEPERAAFAQAKVKATRRVALEKSLSREMLYVKGWPTRRLTAEEAALLASVRSEVSELLGLQAGFLDVPSIHERYAQLLAESTHREAA